MGVRCLGNNSISVSSMFETSEKMSKRSKIDSLNDENELFIARAVPQKWSRPLEILCIYNSDIQF